MISNATRPALGLALLLSLTGCGLLGGKTAESTAPAGAPPAAASEQSAEKHTTVAIEKLERPRRPAVSDVEILWEIPNKPVDGFVIRHGYSRDNLENSARIAAGDVEKVEDPVHGTVYHYLLKNLPPDKKVYITVSAFVGSAESAPSTTLEVEPVN